MLNATIALSGEDRILIEKYLLGADVLNVVVCESAEMIEGLESYKQWLWRRTRPRSTTSSASSKQSRQRLNPK
jgi:hypothetical protein